MEEDIPFRAADCIILDEEHPSSVDVDSWEHIGDASSAPHDEFQQDFDSFIHRDFGVPELRENLDEFSEGADVIYAPSSGEPSVEVAEMVNNASVSSAVWGQMVASSYGQYRARHSDLAFPWESGIFADIFGSDRSVPLPECVGYGDPLSQPAASAAEMVSSKEHLAEDAKYIKAVQSLKDVPYFEGKAHKLELACGLWMDILSIDWSSSEVGAYLAPALLRDSSGGEAVEILRASFGVKSPATLLKRANTFKKFIQWHWKSGFGTVNNCEPFPLKESAVWEYFIHLRSIRVENRFPRIPKEDSYCFPRIPKGKSHCFPRIPRKTSYRFLRTPRKNSYCFPRIFKGEFPRFP